MSFFWGKKGAVFKTNTNVHEVKTNTIFENVFTTIEKFREKIIRICKVLLEKHFPSLIIDLCFLCVHKKFTGNVLKGRTI